MQHIIVDGAPSDFRGIGREVLRGKWGKAFIAYLVVEVILVLIPEMMDVFFPDPAYMDVNSLNIYDYIPHMTLFVSFFLAGPLSVGLAGFFLHLMRVKYADMNRLSYGFRYYFKSFALAFFISLFTALWTLLFIIPGIIASLSYSQAYRILYENPKKDIFTCIRESKIRMTGNKTSLFLLKLSFIGWYLLASIPTALFTQWKMVTAVNVFPIFLSIINFALLLPIFVVNVYTFASETAFYEMLMGHLVLKKQNFTGSANAFAGPAAEGPSENRSVPQEPLPPSGRTQEEQAPEAMQEKGNIPQPSQETEVMGETESNSESPEDRETNADDSGSAD